jgi:hypothetical protein
MSHQIFTNSEGQEEVCGGGGSDPSAAHFSRRLRRAGRSRPGTRGIRNISVTDTERICAGYEPYRFGIKR